MYSARMNTEVVQQFWDALQQGVFITDDLERVAAELNDRPRKRLGFRKPSELLGPLLLR